jgi:hypothetical protein
MMKTARPRAWAWLAVSVLVLVAAAPVSAQPSIGQNFTASSLFTDSPYIPPDTDGAVGPNHFVELINGRFSVYLKAGGTIQQTKTIEQFFTDAHVAPAGGSISDPRILYDAASQHWIASCIDTPVGTNNFLLAASATSDPTGLWTGVRIAADPSGNTWADFPTLGLNHDGVFISANMFNVAGAENFSNVTVLSLPKASLLAGSTSGAKLFTNVGGSAGFSLQPVVSMNDTAMPSSLLWVDNASNALRIAINGPIASPTLGSIVTIPVASMPAPPAARQLGSNRTIDTGDGRLSSSVVRQTGELLTTHTTGGIIWVAQSIKNGNSNSRASILWYKINEASNTVLQSGTIGDSSKSFYYPSVAVNPDGDVVIGFTASSSTSYASCYAVVGSTTAGTTTFGTPLLLKAGVASYYETFSSTLNRWGDYSATTVDPVQPNHFWTIQEFAASPTGSGDIWSTQVTEIIIPKPFSVTATLSASWIYQNTPIATGNRHTSTLTVAVNDPDSNTSYSVGVTSDPSSVGQVIIQPTSNPLVWTIVGGQYGTTAFGPVTLDITVTGLQHGGQGTTTVPMAVRLLGDINNASVVTTNDRDEMVNRLDGLPTPGLTDQDFDLDGDGDVTTADRVLLNRIINTLSIP